MTRVMFLYLGIGHDIGQGGDSPSLVAGIDD
jgi:hypothetical protein